MYSKNENENESHSRLALQFFKEHKLYAKFSKFEFWLRSVAFLSHVISVEGVDLDLKNTDVVRSWPRPFTPTNITSFLGLAG